MEQNISQKSIFAFFIAMFTIAIFLGGKLIAPFFASIILGAVCASIFAPLFRFFLRWTTPNLSSSLTCLITFFLVFIPIVFLVGILSKEAFGLYTMAKDAVLSDQLKHLLENTKVLEKLNNFLITTGINKTITWDELVSPISELGKFIGFSLFDQARNITSNLLNLIFYFCLMILIMFYMLIDGEKFFQYLNDLSPLKDEHNTKLINKFMGMSGAVLLGNGLGGLIQGIAGGALFFVLGFNSPFLWGVIMGFLAFLPIVGIGVVMMPSALILMFNAKVGAGIFTLVFYVVLSWGVEYFLKPQVVGDRVSMHPLIVFFAIIGGLKAYGLLGIIYGPLIATMALTLADIYFSSFQSMVESSNESRSNSKLNQ